MSDNQTLALYKSLQGENALSVMTVIDKLGDFIHQSKMCGVQTPADGRLVAMTCMAESITPLEFGRKYHIIDGRPSMKADRMLAEFKAAGGKWIWLNIGDDGREARAKVAYGGQEMEIPFTTEEAVKMIGQDRFDNKSGNWFKSRGAMLRARLTSKAVRILAPELISGVYTPEELEDAGVSNDSRPTPEEIAKRREELAQMASATPAATAAVVTQVATSASTEVLFTGGTVPGSAAGDVIEAEFTKTTAAETVETQPVVQELPPSQQKVNQEHLRQLCVLTSKFGWTVGQTNEKMVAKFNLSSVTDMTVEQWQATMDAVNKKITEATATKS